jgi:cell division protein FtsZ
VNEAATLIQEEADDEANIIFGAVIDETMGDEVRITVIATGFGATDRVREPVRSVEREIVMDRPDPRKSAVVRELPKAESAKRVVKLGTIIDDGEGTRFVPRGDTNDPAAEDSQYDIPTFLRKQAD